MFSWVLDRVLGYMAPWGLGKEGYHCLLPTNSALLPTRDGEEKLPWPQRKEEDDEGEVVMLPHEGILLLLAHISHLLPMVVSRKEK